MSKSKKIVRSIAIPDGDYQEMMNNLESKGVSYISDKDGKTDQMKLVNGKPTEISTGREIMALKRAELVENTNKSKDDKMRPLTQWGKLMMYGKLVYSKDTTRFFELPGTPGYVMFDVEKDQIMAIIPPPPK